MFSNLIKKMTKIFTTTKQIEKIEKKCVVCGVSFFGSHKSKFCSNKCKKKDQYQRNKLKNNGTIEEKEPIMPQGERK